MIVLFYLTPGNTILTEKESLQTDSNQLTIEQVNIYSEVLMHLSKEIEGSPENILKIASETSNLSYFNVFVCFKGEYADPDKENQLKQSYYLSQRTHKLDASVISKIRAVLVNPDIQKQAFDEIPRLVQNRNKYSKQDYDNKIRELEKKEAQSGFHALSEIIYWKERQYAIVASSFYCGPLCGGGRTFILKKDSGTWKIKTECG